jgi:hypothetical protein
MFLPQGQWDQPGHQSFERERNEKIEGAGDGKLDGLLNLSKLSAEEYTHCSQSRV